MIQVVCTWCGDQFVAGLTPGIAGGPKLRYRQDLCKWCNKLRGLCTSPFHYRPEHRCGRNIGKEPV
jgi:hypothetical protein